MQQLQLWMDARVSSTLCMHMPNFAYKWSDKLYGNLYGIQIQTQNIPRGDQCFASSV